MCIVTKYYGGPLLARYDARAGYECRRRSPCMQSRYGTFNKPRNGSRAGNFRREADISP